MLSTWHRVDLAERPQTGSRFLVNSPAPLKTTFSVSLSVLLLLGLEDVMDVTMTDCFFCGEDLQDPPPARTNAFEYGNSKLKPQHLAVCVFFRLICVSLSAQPAESNRSVGPPTVGGCQLKRRRYVSEQEWEGSWGKGGGSE